MCSEVMNQAALGHPQANDPRPGTGTRAHDLNHGPALSDEPAIGISRERTLVSLSPQASDWMLGLPLDVRPSCTAAWYPHVVNRLCQIWDDPTICDCYFSELLCADHHGRQGFEIMVLEELVELKHFGMGRLHS